MREAVIVDACRSPIGRAGDRGVFRAIGHADMMVPVLKAIVERNKLNPAMIDDVTMGSVALQGIKMMLLVAGFPESIAGSDTTRQCASSTQAIAIAAHNIMNDDADICIAAGLETMDRQGPVPAWQVGRRGAPQMGAFPRGTLTEEQKAAKYPEGWKTADSKLLPFLPPGMPFWVFDMGRTAEELSERFGISRQDSDAFALTSHQKAVAAQDAGLLKSQIIPITINYDDGTTEVIDKDQCPRRETSLERLAALPPSYKENGLVTAGNSCPRSDGAGAVLLMSKEKAKQLGLKPMCTFRHAVAVGVDPTVMGIGPVPSTQKILARTGMKIDDFDIIEINEAFSCQVVYSIHHLGVNTAKLNPLGGAVAIGHPLGMTGTRQTANIAHEMVRRNLRWGLATLCVGGGQGMATIFEREKSY
ncbi:MAG TPA: thiolase family protein [Dehalococcoidales bacterium]|jgi:acetyl-CoA acetyltransferase family protein